MIGSSPCKAELPVLPPVLSKRPPTMHSRPEAACLQAKRDTIRVPACVLRHVADSVVHVYTADRLHQGHQRKWRDASTVPGSTSAKIHPELSCFALIIARWMATARSCGVIRLALRRVDVVVVQRIGLGKPCIRKVVICVVAEVCAGLHKHSHCTQARWHRGPFPAPVDHLGPQPPRPPGGSFSAQETTT